MQIHILGICGTFMGGIAVLAREAGHQVGGSDRNVFPPMSTQLEKLGVPLHRGYSAKALTAGTEQVVVGNVMSRGNEAVEHMLASRMHYTSGPEWLARNVLAGRHVLAVAGTHGKTSTASMLAWILDQAGLQPGFLIGGVPVDFGVSARLGRSEYFVVEADEYDTAFFDKRSKFVHYRPSTLVMTNLEYDHADIFPNLDAICAQFHHLIRTVPGNGRIVAHAGDAALDRVLAMGCWTPVQRYDENSGDWSVAASDGELQVRYTDQVAGTAFRWPGRHNRLNAVAACAAADAVGVPLAVSVEALGRWRGVHRRLERIGRAGGVTVYDDFAHHPTEIAATLQGLRANIGSSRLIAVFEPRSNSMKMGTHRAALAGAFSDADEVFVLQPETLVWPLDDALRELSLPVTIESGVEALLQRLQRATRSGDTVVTMSNGSFDDLPRRFLALLKTERNQ